MHSWAKQEKLDMIKQCFSNMKEDGLTADLQSYAACLECLGRQKNPDFSLLERIVEDVKKDNLDIREMFNQCVFVKDERQAVYQAIRQVLPDYEPNEPREINPYDNQLLENWKLSPMEQVVEKNPYHGVMSTRQLKTRAEQQMDLEVANDVKVKSVVLREPANERTLKMREILQVMEDDWRAQIKQGLVRKMKYMQRKNKGDHGMNLYPFLKLFDMDGYVDLVMKEIHLLATESEHFSPTSSYLWRRLGYRVHQKSLIHQKVKNKITKKTVNLYKGYSEHYANEDIGADNHRLCWQNLSMQATVGPTLDQPEKNWPYHYVKGLGKLLYDIILYDVKFDANILKSSEDRRKIPSFYSIYRNYGHTTKEEIKPHPNLVKVYQGADLEDLTFETKELPMLVPPLPWISAQSGGYLLSSAQLVRLPDQAQGQKNLMGKVAPEKLYPVLDALNTLSACAWKINKPMLDLIVDVFNNKGNKDLDIPPPVSEAPPIPRLSKTMSSEERSRVYTERLRVKQQRSEMYSLWCNELYRLSIANKFRDEIFWFPHNLDFRGRTYPCPPHFNHLGSDVVRSILLFAKGKPLGEKGLDWLKIHLVNLTGFKKRSSNVERLEFANSLMASILDSADKPLTGEKWWQTSDEPWQTLACCMEIAKAVRSGDPTQFVSHFPVHQDGSCNGLQHYAALGRDQAGAESVNLHPFDQPKDVYSDVAILVERERQKDADEGLEVAQVLDGYVRRKVIKQTVMTTVYGVTRYGAKYQILRQLKDIPDFPQEFAWAASMYLTEKTFFCLQEMFSATKEIQDWLTVSAHLISTVSGKPVEWVTPLGFPIVQPYHRTTLANRHGIRVTDTTSIFEKPNAMKQKNAFPPNFIHSLDSTHMMLTAIYCLQAGITYVSVHDCFWTHPCDVEVMNKITREQFVALHEQPILEELSKYLVEKFGSSFDSPTHQPPDEAKSHKFLDSILRQVPQKGDFDLNNVLKSTYFFS
ncbi:DNA-directed RNA polymerase, mitochondrial-like [Liolophura sinensis]|uniref:DNA-directed RNA polymerase, mitochondrial-like n=1 Tax=Liolophura sinensis TaxID=3198878 RepID=UPI0031592078